MRRRVVITGLGCLTPVGLNLQETWHNLVNGVSGVDYITRFDASHFPSKIAGEVKNFVPEDWIKDRSFLPYCSRIHQFGIAAALMAIRDAGLENKIPEFSTTGICMGSTGQYPDLDQLMYFYQFKKGRNRWDYDRFGAKAEIPDRWIFQRTTNTVSTVLARMIGARGPNICVHTACASGSHAIGEAMRIVARGEADMMIAGGTDAIDSPLRVIGFTLLGSLSTRKVEPQKACCPFDVKRDGFVIGEGAAVLILEDFQHARKRRAKIYAEIAGYGTSANAFRVTDCSLDGNGPDLAMKNAIQDSGISPHAIQYIHAHGTSTKQNDLAETRAIKKIFGKYAYQIPITSIKSTIGHLISAAGAVSTLSTAMTLNAEIMPPTINYEDPDPHCDLDYVSNSMRRQKVKYALVNSFGFGGQNVSLVLKKTSS